MAVRLGDRVVRGEIRNTSHYHVHGWIEVRGREHPIHVSLTGNCGPDLAGKHFRFEAPNAAALERDGEAESDDLDFLAAEQVGPTGTMTAERQVKTADCSGQELVRRCELGEPPPLAWRPCLTLEWFGQNGRVLIELPDPVLEFVEDDQDDPSDASGAEEGSPADLADLDEEVLEGLALLDEVAEEESAEAASEAESWSLEEDADDEPDPDDEDPYGLLPEDLLAHFDVEASEVDRAVRSGEDSEVWREMELMDDLIESGPGVELVDIFDEPLQLPSPDQLTDEHQAETALKTLLAQLALYGIALDVCEHYTPIEAYRLLIERICREETAYPELRGTGWVQHFATSDFCTECQAEFEREFEESERRRQDHNSDSPGPDPNDDTPF